MPYDVVVVGSANLDLVATTTRLPSPGETVLGSSFAQYPGGKGLNQAVAASRAGASVALVASLGDDDAGQTLRSVAVGNGIDVSHVTAVAGAATGRAVITVDAHAENSIVVISGANELAHVDPLPDSTVVLAQLEVPVAVVSAAFEVARAAGRRTVLNPAPAPIEGLSDELLAHCDVIVPNEHESVELGGAERLLASGVGTIVTTLGARGARIDTPDHPHNPVIQPPFPVVPIDTTGAGDAFCGNLAARLAAGDDLLVAVRWASAAGALATTIAGAVPSLPRSAAVQELLDAE